MRRFSILCLLLSLTFVSALSFAQDELFDFKGNPASLEAMTGKGKWTIVMFWAHDCHVCNKEAHQYVAFHQKHKDSDAQVVGISLDGKKNKTKAEEFIRRHKLNFDNFIGESYAVAGIFEDLTGDDWVGTPSFLIYDPAGELKAQQVGAVPAELIEQFILKKQN